MIARHLLGLRFVSMLAAFVVLLAPASQAQAQNGASTYTYPRGVLAPGDAVVAGFAGVRVPISVPRGVDPAALTFIDPEGASLRVVDLSDMRGPLDARLVPAPKPISVPANLIGQVFGVALDNRSPPNIYVAATSAYGLPIVTTGADGTLRHVPRGTAGAAFMPALWGRAVDAGGPGSIWKIDGVTGGVSLFTNVRTGDRENSGASLGGLAYDPDSLTLFAVDRESGVIIRYALDGREWSRYDHGVQGRPVAGLAPVAHDPERRIDVANEAFDSTRPETWGYAPPERRVFGIGVFDGRLYYSVADGLQVWSIAIFRDAARHDPRFEFAIPPAAAPTEISKIVFDTQGRMILAERAAPTGAFDFRRLATPNVARVLRYVRVASSPGAPRIWQPEPSDYAIGSLMI